MMVGDSIDDMRSAAVCGFGLRIGLLNGMHTNEVLLSARPDYLVDSVTEVPAVLDTHSAR
jgi:phosphoglycolate phosphatase-like HAD superfamily hydrolase